MTKPVFRLAVISDSHGHRGMVERFLREIGAVDAIAHLGDGVADLSRAAGLPAAPLLMVRGNCDLMCALPDQQVEEVAGVRVLLCHGHRAYVKSGLAPLIDCARANGASLALFGHTHAPLVQSAGGELTLVNPGALAQGRYALIDIADGRARTRLCSLS